MRTETGFIVDSSDKQTKSGDFIWFVSHKKIDGGKAVPVNRGSLEHYLTKNRKKVL